MRTTCLICLLSLAANSRADDAVDFNRDVRPILSSVCLECHGPDDQARQADLRLDLRSAAISELDSGSVAVVPGVVADSALIERIISDDDDLRMPPASSGRKLTAEQIDVLVRWIEQGAVYSDHWSYIPPHRPAVPEVSAEYADWPQNEIDRFTLHEMLQHGLRPSAPADRYALIRRVYLDLTGLPPTIEEADAFAASRDPSAYELVVEELLQRDSFGEHWARKWLDLARYADSAGYADDPTRTIWAWRDWVIRAINSNMPFDQFTLEQLAGDLLPGATDDQIIATAFHRNTMTNSEGGTIDEEFRNVAVVDRVNTTFAVWMGTTIACAQCHSHKYDPISQEEYFQVFAILNNTQDADRRDEAPLLQVYSRQQRIRRLQLEQQIAALRTVFDSATPELIQSQRIWEDSIRTPPQWSELAAAQVTRSSGAVVSIEADGAVLVSAAAAQDTYTVELPLTDTADRIAALRIAALPHESLPGNGPGLADGNFVVTGVQAQIVAQETHAPEGPNTGIDGRKIPLRAAFADYHQPHFEPSDVLTGGTGDKDGWAVGGRTGQSHQLVLIPEDTIRVEEPSSLRVIIDQKSPHASHLLGHFRIAVTTDDNTVHRSRLPADLDAVLDQPADQRSAADAARLAQYYREQIAPELAESRQQLAGATDELSSISPTTTVPVLREITDGRRETRLQYRGNWLSTGHRVTEGVPATFHRFPADQPANRLGLAGWLVDEANPLTARVLVNRYWEALFGRGLVLTSEDFGSQGELPTHPELLDWMATEVMRLGWDRKAILRRIVMSATYCQSAQVTEEASAGDPDNRWLARGPRSRLSAEMVRDQALFASGLLSPKMYGPPVRPPQPDQGLRAAFGSSTDWKTSEGDDRYRRGLYTTWRRSNPYPSMATFDAPNREVCTVRRNSTNTPLQSLVTLNDPVYVEAAQALARNALRHGQTLEEQVAWAFRRCLVRLPTSEEVQTLVSLFSDARSQLAGQLEKSVSLATDPLGPLPEGIDASDAAAMTVVGNVLLNLDEMFLKR